MKEVNRTSKIGKDVLRVRIKKEPWSANTWYAYLVGREFDVVEFGDEYILYEDYKKGHNAVWRHLKKGDCEVIKEQP